MRTEEIPKISIAELHSQNDVKCLRDDKPSVVPDDRWMTGKRDQTVNFPLDRLNHLQAVEFSNFESVFKRSLVTIVKRKSNKSLELLNCRCTDKFTFHTDP
jgi:hypothetical protein